MYMHKQINAAYRLPLFHESTESHYGETKRNSKLTMIMEQRMEFRLEIFRFFGKISFVLKRKEEKKNFFHSLFHIDAIVSDF